MEDNYKRFTSYSQKRYPKKPSKWVDNCLMTNKIMGIIGYKYPELTNPIFGIRNQIWYYMGSKSEEIYKSYDIGIK